MKFKIFKQRCFLGILIFLLVIVTGCSSNANSNNANTQVGISRNTDSGLNANLEASKESKAVRETRVTSGKNLQVSFIDVGQADCILAQIPNGKNLLIDTGNREDYLAISTYLKNHSVSRIDILLLTHMHEDHIGSSSQIIRNFEIGQVIMPRQTATTQVFKDLLNAINSKGLYPIQAKAGVTLDLGSEVNAELLAPNGSSYEEANDYSAVLRLAFGKNVFLFEGDAEELSEFEMLSHSNNLKADVWKIPHHGSSTSSSLAYIAKVKPQFGIISVGEGNSYEHPARDTLSKLANVGVKVYRTDESGTIVAESDGTNITIATLRGLNQP